MNGPSRQRDARDRWAILAPAASRTSKNASDFDSAALHWEPAKALAEELGQRPLLARCRLSSGRLHRRMKQRQQAEERLSVGRAVFCEMDMRFWLEQAEAEVKILG